MERVNLSGREYYTLRSLMAVVSTFEACSGDLEKRIRTIPNGYRDLRLIMATANRLFEKLLSTIPEKKLKQIQHEIKFTRLEVKVNPDYTGRKESPFTYVPQENLEWLTEKIIDMECAFCDKSCKESKKCEIRRNIEALYHYDFPEITGCPLATMNLENLMEGDEQKWEQP